MLDKALDEANKRRTKTYTKLGQYRRKLGHPTDALVIKESINRASAEFAVNIAETVLAYQSLRDSARDNSRSAEILHEDLRVTLNTHHQLNRQAAAVSQNLAPLEKTVARLDRIRAELANLDTLLAGRKDKGLLLANRASSPFVLKNFSNVTANVQIITKQYTTLASIIDDLPRKHPGVREAKTTMADIRNQQVALDKRRQALHGTLAILQEITKAALPPTTSDP